MHTSTQTALLGFTLGCFSALLWPVLPAVMLLPLLLLTTFAVLYYWRGYLVAGALIGILWMASVGHSYLYWQLPADKIQQDVMLSGRITSLVSSEQDVRFNLSVSQVANRPVSSFTARVSWRKPDWVLKAGQSVELMIKLKPAYGLANTGAFNYQQWLLSRNIVATGYVKSHPHNRLLDGQITVRQRMLDHLLTMPLDHAGWLAALTLGYRGLLQPQDWQWLQRTGTSHLVAISGLHLGLVSSMVYLLSCVAQQFFSLLGIGGRTANLHRRCLAITLVFTAGYAAIAGFALPVTRALLMLFLATCLLLSYRYWRPSQFFVLCLALFLALFPHSIFGVSFWLSFTAIVIIWFIFWRWPAGGQGFSLQQSVGIMIRLQLGLSLLMMPLVAWQFNGVSLISPLANLVAVPFVSLLMVPLCLVGASLLLLHPGWAQPVFALADSLWEWAIAFLRFSAEVPMAMLAVPQVPVLVWLLAALAMVILLLPGVPRKSWLSLGLLSPLLSYQVMADRPGWQADVLDVGQGLAVLIHKQGRAVLYDTGAQYPSGFNLADAAILPVLRAYDVSALDRVFISHFDNDHAGSLTQLQRGITVDQVVSNRDLCQQGLDLTWQGLSLVALWPEKDYNGSRNQRSCVLKVTDGTHSLLLPGDIDRDVEARLVGQVGSQLKASVLLAPHHGSATSSSARFIAAVDPQWVIFSQGYANRWGFPHARVVDRYRQQGVKSLKTSRQGQITIYFAGDPEYPPEIRTYRENIKPYWYLSGRE